MPKAAKITRAKRIVVRDSQTKLTSSSAKAISEQVDGHVSKTLKFLEKHPFVNAKFKTRALREAEENELKKHGVHVKRIDGQRLLLNKDFDSYKRLKQKHREIILKLLKNKSTNQKN